MNRLSGEWLSTYTYSEGQTSQHTLEITQSDLIVIGKTIESADESNLSFNLILDPGNNVLTGTWQEETSRQGDYKGFVFHGALQFILDLETNRAEGKWVGFNSDRSNINTGEWILERIS